MNDGDAYVLLLGHCVQAFSQLELVTDISLEGFVSSDRPASQAVVANNSMQWKCDKLSVFVDRLGDESAKDAWNAWLTRVRVVQERRNRLVHDAWLMVDENSTTATCVLRRRV